MPSGTRMTCRGTPPLPGGSVVGLLEDGGVGIAEGDRKGADPDPARTRSSSLRMTYPTIVPAGRTNAALVPPADQAPAGVVLAEEARLPLEAQREAPELGFYPAVASRSPRPGRGASTAPDKRRPPRRPSSVESVRSSVPGVWGDSSSRCGLPVTRGWPFSTSVVVPVLCWVRTTRAALAVVERPPSVGDPQSLACGAGDWGVAAQEASRRRPSSEGEAGSAV